MEKGVREEKEKEEKAAKVQKVPKEGPPSAKRENHLKRTCKKLWKGAPGKILLMHKKTLFSKRKCMVSTKTKEADLVLMAVPGREVQVVTGQVKVPVKVQEATCMDTACIQDMVGTKDMVDLAEAVYHPHLITI